MATTIIWPPSRTKLTNIEHFQLVCPSSGFDKIRYCVYSLWKIQNSDSLNFRFFIMWIHWHKFRNAVISSSRFIYSSIFPAFPHDILLLRLLFTETVRISSDLIVYCFFFSVCFMIKRYCDTWHYKIDLLTIHYWLSTRMKVVY